MRVFPATIRQHSGWHRGLRILAILLPISALFVPALCAAACGHGPSGSRREAVEHPDTGASAHTHSARMRGQHPEPGAGEAPSCAAPEDESTVACCSAAPPYVGRAQDAPHPPVLIVLLESSTRPERDRPVPLESPAHGCGPGSPYARTNPPLLI